MGAAHVTFIPASAMSRPKVLITSRFIDVPLDDLAPRAQLIYPRDLSTFMPRGEVLEHAAELSAIINWFELRIDAELLEAAPRLRIVANATAGFDNFDLDLMAASNVWATNAPEAFTDCTADFTLGLLLAVTRRIVRADALVRANNWPDAAGCMALAQGMLLRDKVLGVVGYGRIGRAVAERAKAFGMRVIHHDRAGSGDPASRSLDDLLTESDIITLHVPLSPGTTHLINAERLARMKPGALLINVARGPVVDEAALLEALRSGHLAGAALDVFEREPEVPEALRAMDNVVLTPHVGAAVAESLRAALRHCIENVVDVLDGRQPREPLNRVPGPA